MTRRCTEVEAIRTQPDDVRAAGRTIAEAATAAIDAGRRHGPTSPNGWAGMSGPAVDAVAALARMIGDDMMQVARAWHHVAEPHRAAAVGLEPLAADSAALLTDARHRLDELHSVERQTWHWRDERASRYRTYQRLEADPGVDASAAWNSYVRAHVEVGELERAHDAIRGELDRAEARWVEIRHEEDRILERLAEAIDGVPLPESSALDSSGLADDLRPLLEAVTAVGGASAGIALLDYVLGPSGVETLRDLRAEINDGDDLGMSNGELNAVRDLLAAVDTEQRALLLGAMADVELERVFHNVHADGFWSNDWNDRERTEFYDLLLSVPTALKHRLGAYSPYLEAVADAEDAATDRAAVGALVDLQAADGFRDLDFDARTALVWQAAFHPVEPSISNLERLAERDWFRVFDLDDMQRSAKLVAFVSQHPGDRTILDNTLDHFLADDAPYRFDWSIDPVETQYGSAGDDEFHFNPRYLDAGNTPVDRSIPTGIGRDRTIHMVTHTVAHEVTHLLHGDHVEESYGYFMAEYRGFWVGFTAQHGHPPTRDDVVGRVEHLLTAPSGAYSRIADAVDDPTEGPLIADFVDEMLGADVDPADLVAELRSGVADGTHPAPVPVAVDGGPNNLDNS